jgi:hypothetical protein
VLIREYTVLPTNMPNTIASVSALMPLDCSQPSQMDRCEGDRARQCEAWNHPAPARPGAGALLQDGVCGRRPGGEGEVGDGGHGFCGALISMVQTNFEAPGNI